MPLSIAYFRTFRRIVNKHTAITLLAAALASPSQADIVLSTQWVQFFPDVVVGEAIPSLTGSTTPTLTLTGDYRIDPAGFAVLLQAQPSPVATLEVNGGSTLRAPRGLFTFSFANQPDTRGDFVVDGLGSRIEIGDGGVPGNILLRGKGDFFIRNGGQVLWTDATGCDGNFRSCDILIGDNNDNATFPNFTGVTNTGFVIDGAGSLLDASNTGGRLFVGFTPAANDGDSDDFLVAINEGEIRSSGAGVAKGDESGMWSPSMGYIRGVAGAIDGGSWSIQGSAGENSNLNIGEGDGASGLVGVIRGGVINVTANPGAEAGFFLGQSVDGVPTQGGGNLLVVSGPGSQLNVDDNFAGPSGSRVANGAVSVQNQGVIELDSTLLLLSGRTGQTVRTDFENLLADPEAPFNITDLPPAGVALDILGGGALNISDNDAQGISALIIGQTPDAGPTQEAHARVVNGTISVSNDPRQPKIALDATAFGIPVVSNVGTGSLEIGVGGLVEFNNGDFVIGVGGSDDATVVIDNGGQLSADRVVVGLSDFEGGPGVAAAPTGNLELSGGIVNGDVIVDDNGILDGVGTVNGAVIGDGGVIAPGFSPGTITAKSFTLGPGTEVLLEVALNADGTVNTALSDGLVVNEEGGTIDLAGAEVTIELSSVDPQTTVAEIVEADPTLDVSAVFESSEDVVLSDVSLTSKDGTISDEELEQNVEVLVLIKSACKKGGWEKFTREDGSAFKNQGDCIQYVNTGN